MEDLEAEMKKIFSFIVMSCFTIMSFAQSYPLIKVVDIKQGSENNCIILRDNENLGDDDFSGNYITITENGTLYINCWDLRSLIQVDLTKKTYTYKIDLSNIQNELSNVLLNQAIENNLLFTDSWGDCKLYDVNNKELKFEVIPREFNVNFKSDSFYYDKQLNILFIYDYDNNIHCILNPSMDQEQNKNNYRTPAQTKAMIDKKEFGTHIALSKSNNLIIDGAVTPWGTVWYGKYRYQISTNNNRVSLWDGSAVKRIEFEKKENEVVESMAIHPSGDIYRLVYDKSTKLHTLYRVENTWDPKWRKEWYKKHK